MPQIQIFFLTNRMHFPSHFPIPHLQEVQLTITYICPIFSADILKAVPESAPHCIYIFQVHLIFSTNSCIGQCCQQFFHKTFFIFALIRGNDIQATSLSIIKCSNPVRQSLLPGADSCHRLLKIMSIMFHRIIDRSIFPLKNHLNILPG